MKNGKKVERGFSGGKSYGLPWMIVLDGKSPPDGAPKVLATSIGPNGNIGCPVSEEEAAVFFAMLRDTRARLTDDELATLRAEHDAFAKPMRERGH